MFFDKYPIHEEVDVAYQISENIDRFWNLHLRLKWRRLSLHLSRKRLLVKNQLRLQRSQVRVRSLGETQGHPA